MPDIESYKKMAISLATQPKKLKALKEKIKQNKLTYPLFDTPRFTRNLEKAYKMMWQNYLDGKKEIIEVRED